MARIELPIGTAPEIDRMWLLSPALAGPAIEMRDAVHSLSSLPFRVREAVRYRIAQINQCPLCLAHRGSEDGSGPLPHEFYDQVADHRDAVVFETLERLAIAYAERFALDHESITDTHFDELREWMTDSQIFELTAVIARQLGFGRMTQVLGIAPTCSI